MTYLLPILKVLFYFFFHDVFFNVFSFTFLDVIVFITVVLCNLVSSSRSRSPSSSSSLPTITPQVFLKHFVFVNIWLCEKPFELLFPTVLSYRVLCASQPRASS